MIPASSLLVLDTNVLVHLIRNGQRIEADYSLKSRSERPLISIVTIGELRSLARKLHWGEEKVQRLDSLARELVVADLRQGQILQRYAEIDYFSEKQVKPARPMGQNDMWIAATRAAAGAHLLTRMAISTISSRLTSTAQRSGRIPERLKPRDECRRGPRSEVESPGVERCLQPLRLLRPADLRLGVLRDVKFESRKPLEDVETAEVLRERNWLVPWALLW